MKFLCHLFGHRSNGLITGFSKLDGTAHSRCARCNAPFMLKGLRATIYLKGASEGFYEIGNLLEAVDGVISVTSNLENDSIGEWTELMASIIKLRDASQKYQPRATELKVMDIP